jgi:ATP synthase F1 complex assembly factor 2
MRAIAGGASGGSAKHKRFWKDVHVKHTDGMDSIQVINRFSIYSVGRVLKS